MPPKLHFAAESLPVFEHVLVGRDDWDNSVLPSSILTTWRQEADVGNADKRCISLFLQLTDFSPFLKWQDSSLPFGKVGHSDRGFFFF